MKEKAKPLKWGPFEVLVYEAHIEYGTEQGELKDWDFGPWEPHLMTQSVMTRQDDGSFHVAVGDPAKVDVVIPSWRVFNCIEAGIDILDLARNYLAIIDEDEVGEREAVAKVFEHAARIIRDSRNCEATEINSPAASHKL